MVDPITIASRHAVFLERLKSSQVKEFEPFLKELRDDIKKRLLEADISELNRARAEKLLAQIESSLTAILTGFTTALSKDLLDIGVYEAGFEARSLEKLIGKKLAIETVTPNPKQVKAALDQIPLSVNGELLEDTIQNFSGYEVNRLVGAIRKGYFEGQTTPQIIRTLTGTEANKYTDSVLAISQRNAETLVRTSIAHASNVARAQTWQENDDVVDGYEWVSTLDSKTSQQCRSLDGKIFKIGKGPLPPIHPRCRSTTAPKLNEEFAYLSEGATRSSKDGYVDANLSYYDWLKTQSKEFQDVALGDKMAKVFRDGGLTAAQFSKMNLDRNFKPLSFDDMQKLEPLAFEKAGF